MFRKALIGSALFMTLAASAPAFAGRLTGPGSTVEVALGHSTDVFHETFRGGELAMIRVSGDGTSDLDLYVYDQFGNLIATDTKAGDECLVIFVPRWTGTFRIEVRNFGWSPNLYVLSTN